MSLCLVHFNKDHIAISGDSRGSIQQNGKYFALNDNMQKIRKIGNKVIFFSGSGWVGENICLNFKNSENQSIEHLQYLSKVLVEMYQQNYKGVLKDDYRFVEMTVATIENGSAILYSISSKENFVIQRFEGGEEVQVASVGAHTEKALNAFNYYLDDPQLSGYEAFLKSYETVANEEVGGTMTVYVLNKNGIDHIEYKIKDSREIQRIDTLNNATDGIKIQSRKTVNDPWESKIFIDTNGKVNADELITNRIKINDGSGITLIDADTKTIDFTNFNTIVGKLKADNIEVDTLDANQILLNGVSINGTDGSSLNIDENGNIEIAGNITMLGGSISWSDISDKPIIPSTAYDVGALPSSTRATDIGGVANTPTAVFNTLTDNGNRKGLFYDSSKNELYVNADYIRGGRLSGVTIDVDTDAKIGHMLYLDASSYNSGIQWDGSISNMCNITYDPVVKALNIDNHTGGIYANGVRIDQPVVAVFG